MRRTRVICQISETVRKLRTRCLITTLLMMLAAPAVAQEALLGSWTGKLNIMGLQQLTLVLHLQQAEGEVKATLDSPDQSVRGIAATTDYLSDDSVAVRVPMLGASLRARLGGGRLEGTFTQRGMSFPIALDKGEETVRRPQTPAPPYPYVTKEVSFSNMADSATLAGTLTYPQGFDTMTAGSVPVVLMVSGSGQQNRDEELFDHKPFLVIADYLARHGIASLRYDDRATGASTGGDVRNATTQHFMRDASAGISFLRRQKGFGPVGCLGHSEGGTIAFMLGARGEADFIVALAAPGVKGDTLLAAQVNSIMQQSGMVPTMTAALYRQQRAVKQSPWLQWFTDYDPSADISHTRCPVFALNGDRDRQVTAPLNPDAIRCLLPPTEHNQVKTYAGLNHLFQHCTTGLPAEYRQTEETIAPEVLSDVAGWINALP